MPSRYKELEMTRRTLLNWASIPGNERERGKPIINLAADFAVALSRLIMSEATKAVKGLERE